jgi:hypothetical protein
MSAERIASLILPGLLSALVFCPVSFADYSTGSQPTKAAGNAGAIDQFRIRRDSTPRLFGRIERNKDLQHNQNYQTMQAQYAAQNQMPGGVQAADYTGSVNTLSTQLRRLQPQSKYIWQQSAAGGYYEASGAVKELVMGDQLFRYGGKFSDGTAVPTTPVVCNFKGHVYFPYVVKR